MTNAKQDKGEAKSEAKSEAPRPGVKLWAPDHPYGCHLSLTNGTTFLVPHDEAGVETPKEFVKPALSEGCVPVGMAKEEPEEARFDRDVLIRTKMEAMYHSDDPSYMSRDGKPNLAKLSSLCGFNVDRADRDRLWEEVETSLTKGE